MKEMVSAWAKAVAVRVGGEGVNKVESASKSG